MEGRAATRMKSAGCMPAVRLSKSVKPVATPVTLPFIREASSILLMALRTIWRMGTKSEMFRFWARAKTFCSAWSRMVAMSSFSI